MKALLKSLLRRALPLALLSMLFACAPSLPAQAQTDEPVLTAIVQDVPDRRPEFTVIWQGRAISALPIRIRLDNQSSPLAFSMDIRRTVDYGDAWAAISMGRPDEPQDRWPSQIGVNTPLPAGVIARGGVGSESDPIPADSALEYAARQVAIWFITNGLALDPTAVPNESLLDRARELAATTEGPKEVPLQAAHHTVDVLLQDASATRVDLMIKLTVDANASPAESQRVDIALDGVRCTLETSATTNIEMGEDTAFACGETEHLPEDRGGRTDTALVNLPRNTKVVDLSATWAGVVSEPGLVMISDGAAPPVITADPAVLNFRTTDTLDPSNYPRPVEILNKAGIAVLGKLPTSLIWPAILVSLYALPRVGRAIDALFRRLWSRIGKRPSASPSTIAVNNVTVTAPSLQAALDAALGAVRPAVSDSGAVKIEVVETPRRRWFRRKGSARIVLHRDTSKGPIGP